MAGNIPVSSLFFPASTLEPILLLLSNTVLTTSLGLLGFLKASVESN